jgi:shikimate 5-dehydrogenase
MELVANNIVQKIGLNYIYQEITMGANDNQTINYIKNQRNSNVTLELKTKLEAVYKAQE